MANVSKRLLIKGTLGNVKYNGFIAEMQHLFNSANKMAETGVETKIIYNFLNKNGVVIDFID